MPSSKEIRRVGKQQGIEQEEPDRSRSGFGKRTFPSAAACLGREVACGSR